MTRPDDTKLPPWLRGVPLPPRPADQTAGFLTPPADLPSSPATPSWLSESVEQPPATAPSSSEDEELPDWLRSLSEVAPAAPAAPPTPSEATTPPPRSAGFTGWLSGASEPASAPAPAPAPPTPPAAGADQIPAWLQPEDDNEPAEADKPLPDWLQNLQPGMQESDDEPALTDTPDWMNTPSSLPGPGADEVTTPAWLRDPETPAAPAPQPPQPPQPPAPPADDIPSWLSSIPDDALGGADDEQDSDLEITPFSLGDIPPVGTTSEWLGASASQLIGSGSQADEHDDLPAWLRVTPSEATEPPPAAPERPAPAPAALPSSAAPPPPSDDAPPDIPSWLRDAAGPIPEDEPPTWSRGPDSPTTSEQDPTLDQVSDATDVPAWLQDAGALLAPAPPASEPSAWQRPDQEGSADQTGGDALPSWLREQHEPQAAAPEPAAPAEADDLPAWLRTSAAPEPPASAAPSWAIEDTPPAAPEASDLPGWLRETAATPAPADTTTDSLPPWLRDDAGAPLPIAVAPEDVNLPAWLRGSDAEASPPPPQPDAPPQPSAAPVSLDWFGDTPSASAAPPTQGSSDLLGGADLPAWLRPETEKPRDTSLDWLARLGPVEDDSPLGISSVEAAPRLSVPAAPVRTPAQMEALSVLRRMAADPLAVAPPQPQPAAAGRLRQIGLERLLSIVLLALLIIGMAVPGLSDGLTEQQATPAAVDLLKQIDQLGAQDIVLIGYEWDAQRVSELRPLERAVINQLLAEKVRVVLVSTDPQGTLMQFDLREQLTQSGYEGGGLDYILLGYRPGGEIGLRQMAQNFRAALQSDFQGRDATIGVLATEPGTGAARLSTLNDFAMAIVFADEPTDVQAWMEQIRPSMDRPITFLVPASVAPMAQPYFRQPGIFHLAGIEDAIAYRQLRGDADAASLAQAGQLHLSVLIYAALLTISIFGVLIYETAARRRRAP